MRYLTFYIIFLGFYSVFAFKLANPTASETTQQVYHYISTRNSFEENRVISGQNCGSGDEICTNYSLYMDALFDETGKYPGLVGIEYEYWKLFSTAELSKANKELISHWQAGGLVTINWAPLNPWTGNECTDLSHADLKALLDPSKPISQKWYSSLDRIANALAELRDAGVVVVWRPLQELNAEWFWWGSKAHPNDPEPFKELWRDMFNYFSIEKGLDNLIWEISVVEHSENDNNLEWYYPGDDYVDMIGTSVYKNIYNNKNYYEQLAFGKPIAACETGPDHCCMDGNWDNMTVISGIRNYSPHTAYFHHWHNWVDHYVAIISNQNAIQLMNDPWVITRDEIDWRPEALNNLPTITLNVQNEGEVVQGDLLKMTADAYDNDGSITKVQFCNGYEILGEDDSAPYDFEYQNVPSGTLHLNARVLDDKNAVVISNFINIESKDKVSAVKNLISNSQFDAGFEPWYWWSNAGTDYSPHVDNTSKLSGKHSARAEVKDGGSDNWMCSFMQGFDLENGAEYSISFQAVANEKCRIDVMFQQSVSPYAEYWKKAVVIDTVAKTFGPYIFKCNISDNDAEFKWRFGGLSNKVVWFDSVVVYDNTKTRVGHHEIVSPAHFELLQNFPNPFNPSTTIHFNLAQNAHVKLEVFDIRGRLLETLVDENKAAGSYSIDYKNDMLSSGTYFYKITAGNEHKVRKMLLIR